MHIVLKNSGLKHIHTQENLTGSYGPFNKEKPTVKPTSIKLFKNKIVTVKCKQGNVMAHKNEYKNFIQ